MSASVIRLPGAEAFDLIYDEHLSVLPIMQQEIMRRSMSNSPKVWIGMDDADILCFLGLIPPSLISDRAYLWLVTTPKMQEHIFLLVRYSQRLVAEMLNEYPLIVGHCETSQDKSIRWLKWLGAKFGEPDGQLIPFEIRRGE